MEDKKASGVEIKRGRPKMEKTEDITVELAPADAVVETVEVAQ